MKKIIGLCCACLLMAFAAFGCGTEATPDSDVEEYPIVMYFINGQYVETGDESLPPLLEVSNYNIYCKEGEQYDTLLLMLRSVPEELSGAETAVNKINFNATEVRGGTAYVDIEGGGHSGGSLEEGMMISQIVNSLCGSFDEIKQVQFLVDGEITESLMGHYDATEPYMEGVYQ